MHYALPCRCEQCRLEHLFQQSNNSFKSGRVQQHLHISQFAESLLVFKKLSFPKHLKQRVKVRSAACYNTTVKPIMFYSSIACTHPCTMAGAVVAFKQAVDERAAAALDERVGVAQLQQPAPEVTSSKRTGTAAYLLQGNTWGPNRKERDVKVRKDETSIRHMGKLGHCRKTTFG